MTSIYKNTRKPDITFHRDGRIDITARVAKLLRLCPDDVIDVAEEDEEYLLYVRLRHDRAVGRYEAQCRPTNRGKFQANNFRAYSKQLCAAVFRAARYDRSDKPLRLPAGTPLTFGTNGIAVPIIIRHHL